MSDHPSKEFQEFTSLVDKLLTVSKSTLDEHVAHHRAKALENPMRPGPRPKEKNAASPARKRRKGR